MVNFEQWNGFKGRLWKQEINVRDFIQKNYTPFDGDESFLAINFGENFKNFKSRKEKKAAFLIWRQKLYQDLQPMDLDI